MKRLAATALLVGLVALTALAWTDRTTAATPQSAPQDEPEPAASPVFDGAALFEMKGCAACHDGPDTNAFAEVAPSLNDVAAWAGERRPGLSGEDYLAESIRDPGVFTSPEFTVNGPTGGMPSLDVSAAEIEALVAYLLGT